MCGIFGSKNRDEFYSLYKENKKRGNFSIGALFLKQKSYNLLKKEGELSFSEIPKDNTLWYLGHTRAPTNTITYFDFFESHPVIWKNWIVGHNGIIGNWIELRDREHLSFSLDSLIIPSLLDKYYQENQDEIRTLKKVFEEIEGIFGCWILNSLSNNLYLVRGASSLYYRTTSFSSAFLNNFSELEEGKIFRIKEKIEIVETFKYDSPYYIP